MTALAANSPRNYPAKYFSAAPTYFVWNALTAHDIHHTLRFRSGFEGQKLSFVLNHPIKFVRLVGLVVDIELLGYGKFLVLCIDDGSGSIIECKAEVRQLPKQADGTARVDEEWPSTTLVDNLDVYVDWGTPRVEIDKQPIDVGAVVKAKGTIDTFRGQRQLKLDRIFLVKGTNEEAKAWREVAEWKADVLSTPWVLTEETKAEIDAKLTREKTKEAEMAKKKRAQDAKYLEKRKRHEEKKEHKRKKMEGAFDHGALVRSNVLPDRFTDS